MANGFLTTSELDLQNYKSSLKTFLSQQEQFKDYDFEGSNLSVLLDLLAERSNCPADLCDRAGKALDLC